MSVTYTEALYVSQASCWQILTETTTRTSICHARPRVSGNGTPVSRLVDPTLARSVEHRCLDLDSSWRDKIKVFQCALPILNSNLNTLLTLDISRAEYRETRSYILFLQYFCRVWHAADLGKSHYVDLQAMIMWVRILSKPTSLLYYL